MLEVCVETPAGIDAAVRGGADRIELCAALGIGGLTPPASLMRVAAGCALPVHVLARPRDGDFRYDAAEQALVADDIRAAAGAGLAGVVIGAATVDGSLDAGVLAAWIGHARALGNARGRPLSLTLHRVFDLTPDPRAALETAVALGFDRILTSGAEPCAVDGVAMLAALHAQAAGRIGVMAGSGVSIATLPAILATGVREVHASCRTPSVAAGGDALHRFGFVGSGTGATDPDRVAGLADALCRQGLNNTNP